MNAPPVAPESKSGFLEPGRFNSLVAFASWICIPYAGYQGFQAVMPIVQQSNLDIKIIAYLLNIVVIFGALAYDWWAGIKRVALQDGSAITNDLRKIVVVASLLYFVIMIIFIVMKNGPPGWAWAAAPSPVSSVGVALAPGAAVIFGVMYGRTVLLFTLYAAVLSIVGGLGIDFSALWRAIFESQVPDFIGLVLALASALASPGIMERVLR